MRNIVISLNVQKTNCSKCDWFYFNIKTSDVATCKLFNRELDVDNKPCIPCLLHTKHKAGLLTNNQLARMSIVKVGDIVYEESIFSGIFAHLVTDINYEERKIITKDLSVTPNRRRELTCWITDLSVKKDVNF